MCYYFAHFAYIPAFRKASNKKVEDKFLIRFILVTVFFSISPLLWASEVDPKATDGLVKAAPVVINHEALQIGEMVQALQIAINSPNDHHSLKTITLYGADRRYYQMIRGWLFQELVLIENKLYASKSAAEAAKFQYHSNFLKHAIRLVDSKS